MLATNLPGGTTSRSHEHLHEDVESSGILDPHLHEGFLFDKIGASPIRRQVDGIGLITSIEHDSLHDRDDIWYSIEVNGFALGVRVTEPVKEQELGINIVHFPGFTEVIESGPGKSIHDRFAEKLPGYRIISVASDGVGNTGEKLTLENMWDHGIDEMAKERLTLLQAICGDEPVIIQGLSMGSVIANNMIQQDLNNGQNLHPYALHFDTALVTPQNVKTYMLGLFAPSMVSDVPRELFSMCRRYGIRGALTRLVMSPEHLNGNLLPSIVEASGLKDGTDYKLIEKVAKAVGVTTVSGQFDPLAQFPMWRSIKKEHPGTHISTVRWRGHGMVADGAAAADKMIHVIDRDQILERLVA